MVIDIKDSNGFLKKSLWDFFVVCLRFALIIITRQINNYFVLIDFIQLLLVNVSVFDFFLWYFFY